MILWIFGGIFITAFIVYFVWFVKTLVSVYRKITSHGEW